MIAYVMVLFLSVRDCDTGAVLYESMRQMPDFTVSGNFGTDCREVGTKEAMALTERFRKTYPNASTNVVCKWVKEKATAPA